MIFLKQETLKSAESEKFENKPFFAQVGVHQLSINFLTVKQYGLLLEAFFPFSSFVPYLSLQRSLPAFIYIAGSLLFMPCCVPTPLSTPGYAPNTVFLSYSKKREQTFILPYLVTTQRQDKQVVFTSGSQTYLKKKKKKVIVIAHAVNSVKRNGCYTIYCTGHVCSENKEELPCRGLQNPTTYALYGIQMDVSHLKRTSTGNYNMIHWVFAAKNKKSY